MGSRRVGKPVLWALLVPVVLVGGLFAFCSAWIPLRTNSLHNRLESEFRKVRFPPSYRLIAVAKGGSALGDEDPNISPTFRVDINPSARRRLYEELLDGLKAQGFRLTDPSFASTDAIGCLADVVDEELQLLTGYSRFRDRHMEGDCPRAEWDQVYLHVVVYLN